MSSTCLQTAAFLLTVAPAQSAVTPWVTSGHLFSVAASEHKHSKGASLLWQRCSVSTVFRLQENHLVFNMQLVINKHLLKIFPL